MLKSKSFYANLCLIFFCVFPFVEVYRTYFGDTFSIFGFAIEELFVMLFAAVIGVAGFIFSIIEKKKALYITFIAYFAIFVIYAVLHSMNTAKFDASLFVDARPDFIAEMYSLVRMFALPFAVGFAAISLGFGKKRFIIAANTVAFEISAIIVISTALGISLVSYSYEMQTVKGSFFAWASLPEDADFALYTAKGFFSSSNFIGALLFALSPIVLYNAFKNKSVYSSVTAFLMGLSMITLGTKVALFGFMLSLLGVLFAFILDAIIKKEYKKIALPTAITSVAAVLYLVIAINSPGYKMQNVKYNQAPPAQADTGEIEIEDKDNESDEKKEIDIDKLEAYIDENKNLFYIKESYLELYPVKDDPEFWLEIITRDRNKNISNRDFKTDLLARIIERNNNPLDKYLGIGYTSARLYSERDYYFQYQSYGILGLIVLILPFFISLAFGIYITLKKLFGKKELLFAASVIISLVAFLFTAYFAGYVFFFLMNIYFISLIGAFPFYLLTNPESEENV